MALKVLLRKFKALRLRRFATKAIKDKKEAKKRGTWVGMSHGFHTVERDGNPKGSVLAQREQIEGSEMWLFEAFDQQMGCGITKYLQSHLFDKKLNEYQIGRKAKETMRKAYISTGAKIHKGEKANEIGGSTTVLVMNRKQFVAAAFGGYKAVVCKDGMAVQIGRKYQRAIRGQWPLSGILCVANGGDHKPPKDLRLVVTAQNVEPDMDFIILASNGVWEVMRYQEAVDLIGHIENAQRAAECLAEEALSRMSKSTISCIVIRFH
ncbi:putative protein phosphatase 2C-like protein 44 isoform X2 [Elaeis guineensis]|uniref:protein-serine/threonine phosphatase n=1 Tax=Elaeis guineensis var. tenera TaxID=51953 RepID=A0A6I9S295_ELAGV|nr:putative protein phosphatase 2C-like protein 44 isoform X2 [Elaeis guineensis]